MAPVSLRSVGLAPLAALASLAIRADATTTAAPKPTRGGQQTAGDFTYDDIMDGVLSFPAEHDPMGLDVVLTDDLSLKTSPKEASGLSTDDTSQTVRLEKVAEELFTKMAAKHFAMLKGRTTHQMKTGSELRAKAQTLVSRAARREAAIRKAERRKAERQEAERRAEAERREAERRAEAELREAERREAERREAERADAARKRERQQEVMGLLRRIAEWSNWRKGTTWVDPLTSEPELDAEHEAVCDEHNALVRDIFSTCHDCPDDMKVKLRKELFSTLEEVKHHLRQQHIKIWLISADRLLKEAEAHAVEGRSHAKLLRGDAKLLLNRANARHLKANRDVAGYIERLREVRRVG